MTVRTSHLHTELEVQHDHGALAQMLPGHREKLRGGGAAGTRFRQFDQPGKVQGGMGEAVFTHRQSDDACVAYCSVKNKLTSTQGTTLPSLGVEQLQCFLHLD